MNNTAGMIPTPQKGRTINPTNFARELVEAIENDPGAERKAMLFEIDGREMRFVAVTSEARVTVIRFTEDLDVS